MKLFAPLLGSMLVTCLLGCGAGADKTNTAASKGPSEAGDTNVFAETPSVEDAKHTVQVHSDLRKVKEATVAGDLDVILHYTHPKLFELAGGEEKFSQILEQQLAAMKESKVTFGDVCFPAPPEFIETAERLYAVIPQQVTLSVPAGGGELRSYQLGVLENGNTAWKYIDVSKWDRQMFKEAFPDFPEDYTFPEVSMKQL